MFPGYDRHKAKLFQIAVLHEGERTQMAEQGARANAGSCHAACDLRSFEMKNRNPILIEAHGAPAPVVAHL